MRKNNIRRRRKNRRRLFYLAMVLTGILIFTLFPESATAKTETKDSVRYKYYTSIAIEEGNTLWDIAQIYMTEEYESAEEYIKEVKKINHMKSDLLYGDSYLCIPYYSSECK